MKKTAKKLYSYLQKFPAMMTEILDWTSIVEESRRRRKEQCLTQKITSHHSRFE